MLPKGQDFFSLSELFFVAVLAANLLTLAAAAWTVLAGGVPAGSALARRARRARAVAMLRGLAMGDAAYVALVLVTSLQRPDPIPAPHLGDPLCLGHRCISVEQVTRMPTGSAVTYAVTLRLTNSARYAYGDRVAGVYLLDDRGRRYAPAPDASERSLTAQLEPGETATTRRVFALPADARATGFVVQRGGGPPLRCVLVGGNCWFPAPKEPPVVIE
jgi:hypothetical protein